MSTLTGNALAKPHLGKSLLAAAIVTAALLVIPLVAMQFTAEVNWTGGDFAVMGMLLMATGTALVFANRLLRSRALRLVAINLIPFVFVLVWAELAVGVFTNLGS